MENSSFWNFSIFSIKSSDFFLNMELPLFFFYYNELGNDKEMSIFRGKKTTVF